MKLYKKMTSTNDQTSQEPTGENIGKALSRKERITLWFKRLGWAAFWFFVIKGTITSIIIIFFGKKAWEAFFE